MNLFSARLILTERLTLAVLLCGVVSLALSDFVSPFYWGLVVSMSLLRLWRGPGFALSELQASLFGWAGFVWVGIELALGRELIVAFTDFLLILSLAIIVEAATPRNHLHRMLVGFFLILGAAVLTDSVLYIVPLVGFVVFVWRASQCLYGMQLPGGDLQLALWRENLKMIGVILAMSGILFAALPRFEFHSFLKPVQPRMQTVGFSDRVNLGDFARSLDPTVVYRIEPLGDDAEMFRKLIKGHYWRGVTLSKFNGIGWERSNYADQWHWIKGGDIRLRQEVKGEPFAVYREATDHAYIVVPYGIGKIFAIPERIKIDNQGVFSFHRRVPDRRLRIVMQFGQGEELLRKGRGPVADEYSLDRVSTSLKRWAEEVAGGSQSPQEIMKSLEVELKSWEYDLNAPLDQKRPVSSFLELKRGHCELFATALALAARSKGIATRVVNGYSNGEWNEVGGFYLIRQQHAHSWVEAWIDGRWQRYDATPVSRWLLSGVDFPEMDEVWESIKLTWYRYVLEFQNSDRSEIISSLNAMFQTWKQWIIAAVVLITLVVWARGKGRLRMPAWRWRPENVHRLDRWLRQRGVTRLSHQPVRHLPLPGGVQEKQWRQFVLEWESQAYGKGRPWTFRELNRHLRAL